MATPTVQQVLAEHDETKAVELLFTLLAEQAQGRELSAVAADIAQGVLKSNWGLHVKRLAYDLCKAVPLSDADSQFIISGIRLDINSGDAELCALALRHLAHIQPHLLAGMLSTGELAQLCSRPLASDSAAVRAAAVGTLGSILLVPEVLHAASSSAGMANQVNEHWQTLTDALLDDEETVVAAAVSVTTSLLRSGLSADIRTAEGYLLERLASISAARVVSALAAVVHAFSEVSTQARVDTLTLLHLLVEHAVRAGQWEAEDVGGAAGLPSGTLLPGLASLAPAAWGYCASLLRSGDPAVRLEAARTVLRVAALVSTRQPPRHAAATRLSTGDSGTGVGTTPGSIPQPTGLVLQAISSLLEIEDSVPLVEAAAEDVLSVVVDGLPALTRRERASVLLQLWAGIGRVKNTPARMELWSRAWASVVQDDDPMAAGSPDSAASLLALVLGDGYVSTTLSGGKPSGVSASANARTIQIPPIGGSGPPPAPHRTAPAAQGVSTDQIMAGPSVAQSPSPAAAQPAESFTKGAKSRFFGMLGKRDKEKDTAASVSSVQTKETSSPPTKSVAEAVAQAAANAVTKVSDLAQVLPGGGPAPEPARVIMPASYGAQRHELTACLLSVVHACHPASGLAWQLCADVAATTAHDQAPGPALSAKYGAWQQQRVLSWVTAARAALQATAGCMLWEPYVVPAITPNANAAHAQRPQADFSSTVQDAWLQLLQAASAATRALLALAKPPPAATGASLTQLHAAMSSQHSETSTAATTPRQTPNASISHPPLQSLTSMASGAGSAIVAAANPTAHAANMEARDLANLVKQVFREWGSLSRAVRGRALWVACHAVDMAPHADELWEHGLKALQDVLCKLISSGNVARVSDLLGSAAQGVLYRSGRVGWPRDRPFMFDVVAAGAMCERPDYDAIGLVVGLTAAQAWATRLQDALAVCAAESSKRVMGDVVFQAGRLEAVLREFMATPEAAGSPVLREWGKRTMRALAATAVFQHPAARALEEAEAAAKAAKEAAEKAAEKEQNGYENDTGIINSSSSSSEAGEDMGNLLPVSLPTSMYLPGGAGRARPALPPQHNASMAPVMASLTEQRSIGFTTGQMAGPGSPSAHVPGGSAGREQEPFKARAALLHGNLPAHMVASSHSAHPWGYPFAPAPRASAIFYSKRARRSRVLAAQMWRAMARCSKAARTKDQGLSDVPALPKDSALRLDSPAFWALLPSGHSAPSAQDSAHGGDGARSGSRAARVELVELCGPGDPVMLVGSVARDGADAAQLVLRVTAINRSDVDVRGAVLQVLALGPAQLDRRAAGWMVPRLSPRDRITHSFTLKLLGYGLVRLSCRLQLVHAGTGAALTTPVIQPCRPLHVGLVHHMLHVPLAGAPSPRAFFSTWSTLPVRAELAAACLWPGREGAAAALSAMLRSPLACTLLTYVDVTATYQMALAGETATGEEVFIVVHAQLLPPPATNSVTDWDMGLEDTTAKAGKDAKSTGKEKEKDTKGAAAETKDEKGGAGAVKQAAVAAIEAAAVDAARQPHALLHISVRSALPDIALALTAHPTEFVNDLAAGSAQLLGAHWACAAVGGAGAPKPPIHPRVAALETARAQSLRALPTATSSLLSSGGQAMPDVYAQGVKARSKVSHKFMEAAAAAEWQRLVAQPV